jgi:hypothetical protein
MVAQNSEIILSLMQIEKCSRMPEKSHMSSKTIEQVLTENTKQWMAIGGIAGTAVGVYKGRPCIKIYTTVEPCKVRDQLPSRIEGYPVIIEQTGSFRSVDQQ